MSPPQSTTTVETCSIALRLSSMKAELPVGLPDIHFGAQTTLPIPSFRSAGHLKATDGRHAITIALLGSFTAGSFATTAGAMAAPGLQASPNRAAASVDPFVSRVTGQVLRVYATTGGVMNLALPQPSGRHHHALFDNDIVFRQSAEHRAEATIGSRLARGDDRAVIKLSLERPQLRK
jgi:hypothetical protein